MKLIWRIFLSLITLEFIVLSSLSIYVVVNSSNGGRDVYLSGFENTGAKKTGEINTFFADEADNMALYKQNDVINNKNNINTADFYGDVESYDYANNPNDTLRIWKNDAQNINLILKNNPSLQEVKVAAFFEQRQGLSIDFGWNEFIYASYGNNNSIKTWGVNESLLVPDKVTNHKTINNLNKNKVNQMLIRVHTTDELVDFNEMNIIFKVEAITSDGDKIEKENILKIVFSENDLNDVADYGSVFFFSNFSRTANYISGGELPSEDIINDINDPYEFITKMWPVLKNEYEYMANELHQDFFISNVTPDRDPLIKEKYYWTTESIHISLMEWHYSKEKGLYATDESWKALEFYLTNIYELGMRKWFMQGIQNSWAINADSMYVINDDDNVTIRIPNGSGEVGNQVLGKILDEISTHVSMYSEKIEDMEFVVYTDEKSSHVNSNIIEFLETYNVTAIEKNKLDGFTVNKFLFGMSAWERDINYSHKRIEDADYLWIYFLDYYNSRNKNFTNLLSQRNSKDKFTGQYSLDADNTFNLVRAEPGVSSYIMLALAAQGSPHYMKYSLNAWHPKFARWSSDYDERDEYGGRGTIDYLSGDTIFSYPSFEPGDFSILEKDNIEFHSSTRLESYTQGLMLIRKIEFLKRQNSISEYDVDTLYKNVDIRNKNSKTMSNFKFDLQFNKLSNVDEINKNSNSKSYLARYFASNNSNADETTSYKVIKNYINKY